MSKPKIYPELVRKLLDDAEKLEGRDGAWEELHDNVRPIIEQILTELEAKTAQVDAWRETADRIAVEASYTIAHGSKLMIKKWLAEARALDNATSTDLPNYKQALADITEAFHKAWCDHGYDVENLGVEYDSAIALLGGKS